MLLLLPIAFLSGALTVLSPCVLPILPIILSSGIDGKISRVRGTILGLVTSFTVASLLLATIVQFLGVSVDVIRMFAVGLLVIFGASMLLPNTWNKISAWIEMHWKFQPHRSKSGGFWGGFVTGISLGVVWTPCIGPVVAAVATLAAVNALSISSFFIVFAYALGTGLPLYFIAKGGAKASQRLGFVKNYNAEIRQIFGIIIILTAMLIATGVDRRFQEWTLSNLPESWTNLAATFENRFDIDEELEKMREKRRENKPAEGTEVVRRVPLSNDFTDAKVSRGDLISGCFGQDCIPSIDEPIFETANEATWLNDDDRVFSINLDGVKKTYPQRILNWHEIVNDWAGDTPVAVTFCPLCGSALAFERKVDGIITEFGVSGKLHNNDLVMYDRYEGSMWQQVTGEGIVGPAAQRDELLTQIPLFTTTWAEWRDEHPDTLVLSRETGHSRDYSLYPYDTYEENDELLFGIKELDTSLQIKTPVLGIEVGDASKAYPVEVFDGNPVIEDTIGEVNIKLEKQDGGEVIVTNLDTGEEIVAIRLFWFAWAAFHPDTELFTIE